MISRLSGILLRKEPPALLVDVNGVGYELEAPMTTFYDLPAVGEKVTLFTHLVVREDAHLLYGFSREAQRRLFRGLLKVNGVGPRVALAVLSGLADDEFVHCVLSEDVARLTQVPGIGRKTAERLIVEMRDKLPQLSAGGAPTPASARAATQDPVSEAMSALIALGYKPNEASRAVRAVPSKGLGAEEIIRQALKSMAL
ncbi:MAG TPA: Holliday junction branch migration protein RuvA [Burkholderiales bacterium]|nr:Holliday junction branch migration protein RuvA [Burkholderiales bacterium]